MLKKISLLLCISIVIVCLDQLTKTFVHTQFNLHESKGFINGFINITYIRNFGAAFGFLEKSNAAFRDLFMLLTPPLICGLILSLIYYIKSENMHDFKNNMQQLISLSLIFGGAAGNYFDRVHYGYVIDFIDIHWNNQYNFPAFNIADSAIVIGVFFLILSILKEKKHEATS